MCEGNKIGGETRRMFFEQDGVKIVDITDTAEYRNAVRMYKANQPEGIKTLRKLLFDDDIPADEVDTSREEYMEKVGEFIDNNLKKADTQFAYEMFGHHGDIPVEDVDAQDKIVVVCDALKMFMLEKNRRYGNSALEPNQTFTKLSAGEQLNVRMDDKLNRIKNSDVERMNDHVDLLGYLILKCVDKGWFDFESLID